MHKEQTDIHSLLLNLYCLLLLFSYYSSYILNKQMMKNNGFL